MKFPPGFFFYRRSTMASRFKWKPSMTASVCLGIDFHILFFECACVCVCLWNSYTCHLELSVVRVEQQQIETSEWNGALRLSIRLYYSYHGQKSYTRVIRIAVWPSVRLFVVVVVFSFPHTLSVCAITYISDITFSHWIEFELFLDIKVGHLSNKQSI